IVAALLQKSSGPPPHSSPSPSPSPSPTPVTPTEPSTSTTDDNNRWFVNFDTSAAIAFGMVNPDYSNHPALLDIIREVNGRRVLMTGTAIAEFRNTMGYAGYAETIRSSQFLTLVTPIADNPSVKVAGVRNPGGAKHDSRARDINIFGTGDQYGIETITGDDSFVQFLRSNNITLNPPAYVFRPPARFSGL